MNIYDISKKAGVSIATVSRVINRNAYVSDKTRKKVLDVIDECGYTPNVFARGLGLNTMNTVGILCADSSDPYIASAIFYLQQELRKNNYDALLCCTGYELDTKRKYMELLLSKRTDAIILVGSNFVAADDKKNQYIREAAKSVPILIVNAALDGPNIYCSLCNDRHATYDATKSLLDSGHENILYLYNAKSYSGMEKLGGFLDALNDNRDKSANTINSVNNDYIQYCYGSIDEIKEHLNTIHKKGLPIDAIMTADDILAVGALKFAKENQLSIPNQLAIIGYNNSILSLCSDPELTSVDNKLETVCANCISTLMGVFQGKEVPLKTVFPAELIRRDTTRL